MAKSNIYLTSYHLLDKGKIIKMAGPDILANNTKGAMQSISKRNTRLPIEVDGKLICKIRK